MRDRVAPSAVSFVTEGGAPRAVAVGLGARRRVSVGVRARVSIRPVTEIHEPDRRLSLETTLTLSRVCDGTVARRSFSPEAGDARSRTEAPASYAPARSILAAQQMLALDSRDPLVWIQFVDAHAVPLSAPVCLGRVSESPCHAQSTFIIPIATTAQVEGNARASRRRLPELDETPSFIDGVSVRLLFAMACDQAGAPSQTLGAVDAVVVPPLLRSA